MTTLYAAMRDTLLCVQDDGGEWTAEPCFHPPSNLECLAVGGGRLFAGTFGHGLHRSPDGGTTWERVGADTVDPDESPETAERRGVDGVSVMSVAVDPTDPDTVYAGTEPSAVFTSTDGGDTWNRTRGVIDRPSADEWAFPPRPYTHHVRWIEVDPCDPDRVYASIEAGALLRSDDAGETWTDRAPGTRRDNHSLATHPAAAGRAWAAAGDGYAETSDGGDTWEHPQTGLDHRYCWSVALDAADPDTVLLSAATGAGRAHGHGGAAGAESYVYRKRGRDGEWERADRGLPAGEGFLRAVLASGDPAEFFAVSNRGLYRTADAGGSWERLEVEWPGRFAEQSATGLVALP